jgi:hypothetical protein
MEGTVSRFSRAADYVIWAATLMPLARTKACKQSSGRN